MRVGTWNCRLDIDGKRSALEQLALDVAVVPESAAKPPLAVEPGVSHAWTGRNERKGLGVFAFGDWSIHPIVEDAPLPWCLPVTARHLDGGELTVLAVWAVKNRDDGRPTYAAQFAAVIERWRHQIEHGDVIVAGDLNASFQGPSAVPHGRNLDALAALGAHSAYRVVHGAVEPHEEPATLRWIGPGRTAYQYHCDYVIVSKRLAAGVRGVEVGSLAEWVESGLSDHCPVVVELDGPAGGN
jgi:hypothetical protein